MVCIPFCRDNGPLVNGGDRSVHLPENFGGYGDRGLFSLDDFVVDGVGMRRLRREVWPGYDLDLIRETEEIDEEDEFFIFVKKGPSKVVGLRKDQCIQFGLSCMARDKGGVPSDGLWENELGPLQESGESEDTDGSEDNDSDSDSNSEKEEIDDLN